MKIKIIADSCGDLTEEAMKKYDIGMIPLNIELDDLMRDRVDIAPKEYYDKIKEYSLPITSSPNLAQWKEAFDSYLQNGYDKVVVITLSSKLSNTYDQAMVAARKFYPNDVKIIDSRLASGAEGLLAIKFREIINKGYDLETTYNFMQELREEVILVAYMENLKMLAKSGRISRASEFIANLGQMKPMVVIDNGELVPLTKVISLKNAKKRIVSEVVDRADETISYTVFSTHANDFDTAVDLQNQVKEQIKTSKSFINFMGPVVGSRVGLNAQILAAIPDIEPDAK
jgi:DegV family protein with EDD domain